MNGSLLATRVTDVPGHDVTVHGKKHAGIQSPNSNVERKTTATIRSSKPSSIRPPKRSADKPIIKEIQSSSETESTPVIPRILTAIDMFTEKSGAKPKFQEKQQIPIEIQNFNMQASPKKSETMAKSKCATPETKGHEKKLCSSPADKKKNHDIAKTCPINEKKPHSKKHKSRKRETSPKAASAPRNPSDKKAEHITSPPSSPDKPNTLPSAPDSTGGAKLPEEKIAAVGCMKQLPRQCSVVIKKIDMSHYKVQDENDEETVGEAAMERTPKRKMPIKSGQTERKKSKRASSADTDGPYDDDVALLAEVLNASQSSVEETFSVEIDNVSLPETSQYVLVASSGEESFSGFSPDQGSSSRQPSKSKVKAEVPKKPRMKGLKSRIRAKKRPQLSLVGSVEVRNLLNSNKLHLGSSELHNLLANTKRPVRKCCSNSKSNLLTDADFDDDNEDYQTKLVSDQSSPAVDVSLVHEKKRKLRGGRSNSRMQSCSNDSEGQLDPAAIQGEVANPEVAMPRKSRSSRRSHADESQRSPIADLDMIDQKLDEVSKTNTSEQVNDVDVPCSLEFDGQSEDSNCNRLNDLISGENQEIEIACNVQVESNSSILCCQNEPETDQEEGDEITVLHTDEIPESPSMNIGSATEQAVESVEQICDQPTVDISTIALVTSIAKFLALKQSDPVPSAYAYNPESRVIKQVDRATLDSASLGEITMDKPVVILTEEDLQGDGAYKIDDLLKLAEKKEDCEVSLAGVEAPETIPLTVALEVDVKESLTIESPPHQTTPLCESPSSEEICENGVTESQSSSQVDANASNIETVSSGTMETPIDAISPCDAKTIMTSDDHQELKVLSKSEPLPISQVDTEVLGLMHQGDDSSSLSPTLEDSLLHPEEELPSTKPIADVAPFKDILDVVAESLPIKGESSVLAETAAVELSNEIGPNKPPCASTSSPMQIIAAEHASLTLQTKSSLPPHTDYSECLGTCHRPKKTNQEVQLPTKHPSKVIDSFSSDTDEVGSEEDQSSSADDLDNAHKQGKKKKKSSNQRMSIYAQKYLTMIERTLSKTKIRNKQLRMDRSDFKEKMSCKDEALGRYKSFVDAIVEKVMANPELSSVLDIPSVPGAVAILEQSKVRVVIKQATKTATRDAD